MKIKLISLLTAAVMPVSLCSCSLDKLLNEHSSIPTHESSVSDHLNGDTPDLEQFNDLVRKFLDDLKKEDNEDTVRSDIDELIRALDIACEHRASAQLDSYLEWDNEELEAKLEDLEETAYIMNDALAYAFAKGAKSRYSGLFTNLVSEDDIEYFNSRGMSLEKIEGYSSVNYRFSDELVDKYFEVSYDESLSNKKKDLKCAEIYLEILANCDVDSFYSDYFRDYTPQDILSISDAVREYMIPAYDELFEAFCDAPGSDDVFSSPFIPDDPFEVIERYSEKLSPDIHASASKLRTEDLYTIASGDNCYTGSYTETLCDQDSALIYLYSGGSFYDFSTAVHEFGHFHAGLKDPTSQYEAINDLDVAEIQSQGMELLFMQFYDDIYGKQSDAMKLMTLSSITDSVITGFLIGEFEYTALTRADELSPQDVLDLYDSILGDYAEDYPFYCVNHIFEVPGYYISYGVSALAALDIANDCIYAPDKALEWYERIAAIPASSDEWSFRKALKECGCGDVLSEDYIRELSGELVKLSVVIPGKKENSHISA